MIDRIDGPDDPEDRKRDFEHPEIKADIHDSQSIHDATARRQNQGGDDLAQKLLTTPQTPLVIEYPQGADPD